MNSDELKEQQPAVGDVLDLALSRHRLYEEGPARPELPRQTGRELLKELFDALARWDEEPWRQPLPGALAFGQAWAREGYPTEGLAREVSTLVRGLEESLEERHALAPAERGRLRLLGEEALVRALAAYVALRRLRQEGWLSHYVHEMRNPLNTLVNALWLLRNIDRQAQAQRICDMAERAVKKLEVLLVEVRDLERRLATEPPGHGF